MKKNIYTKKNGGDTTNLLKMDSRGDRQNKIIGYLNSIPHPMAVAAYIKALRSNPNNLGLQIKTQNVSGFKGSNMAEKKVITELIVFFGGDKNIWGYISPGGTESNIVALWATRNFYKSSKIAVIGSFLTHYSIIKAINILGIVNDGYSGFHELGTDEEGRILTRELEQKLDKIINKVDGIVIVANVGTTMIGGVDEVSKINTIVNKYRKNKKKSKIHIHVDAAFGGLVAPFVFEKHLGFKNSNVFSLTVDMHKMGLVPFGSGIILMKKQLFKKIGTRAGYISWKEQTLCGSRPGAAAHSCLVMLEKFCFSGYKKNAIRVCEMTEYVKKQLAELHIEFYHGGLNIISIRDKKLKLWNALTKDGYRMHYQKKFPNSLRKPKEKLNDSIWNIVIMPSMSNKFIDQFISKIRQYAKTEKRIN